MSAKASQNHWDLIASLPTDGSHIAGGRAGRKSGGVRDREPAIETAEAQATTQGRGKKGNRRQPKPVRKAAASMPQSYLLQIEQEERVRSSGSASPSPIAASATSDLAAPLRSPSLVSLRPPSPLKSPPPPPPPSSPRDDEQEIWIPAVLMDYLDAEWKPVSKKKPPKTSNQPADGSNNHSSGGGSSGQGRQTSAPIPIISMSQLDESPKRSNISLTLPPPSPDSRRTPASPTISEPLLPPPTPPAKLSPSPRWNGDDSSSGLLAQSRSQSQSQSFEQLRLASISFSSPSSSPTSAPSSPSSAAFPPLLASPSASSFSSPSPVPAPTSSSATSSSPSPHRHQQPVPAATPTPSPTTTATTTAAATKTTTTKTTTTTTTTGSVSLVDQGSPAIQASQSTPPSSPSQTRKHPQQPQPPPASSVDIPDDLFCESCQRTFAKSTVYLGHLAGRPHRVAERKRLERLQSETAEQSPAASAKTAKPPVSTTTATASTTSKSQTHPHPPPQPQQPAAAAAAAIQQQSPRTSALQPKSVGRGKGAGPSTALATGTAPLGVLLASGSPPAASNAPCLSPRSSPSILSTSPRASSSPLVSPRISPTSSPVPPPALSPLSSPSSSPTPPRKYQQPQPPPASSVVIPDDLFCESCQRTFAKQTVYLGHLAGRPHRVAERKRLERLEAGSAAAAAAALADGKTKGAAAGGGKGSQPNSPTTPRSGKRAQPAIAADGAVPSSENQTTSSRSPRPRRGSGKGKTTSPVEATAIVVSGDNVIAATTTTTTTTPVMIPASAPTPIGEAIARQRPTVDLDDGMGTQVDPLGKDIWSSSGSPSLATSPSVFSSPFGLPSYQFFGSNSILPDFALPAFPSPRQGLPLPYPDVSEVLPELDFPLPRAGETTRGAAGDSAFPQTNFSSPPSSPGPQRSRFGFALQDDSHAPSPDPSSIWPIVANSPFHPTPADEEKGPLGKGSPFPLSSDGLELDDPASATLSKKMRSPRLPPGFSPDPKVPPPGFTSQQQQQQQQKTYIIPARR